MQKATISSSDLSTVRTYGELRDALPSTGSGKVPGYLQLRDCTDVLISKTVSSGVIEVYSNGFFTYEEEGRVTVYGVDRCERPETFEIGRQLSDEELNDIRSRSWELILECAGTARQSHNSESREDYQCAFSLDDEASEDNIAFSVRPDYEIREEEEEYEAWKRKRNGKMLAALRVPTTRQQGIAMMYYRDKMTEKEIASVLGKTQQYVSKTIVRYREIVFEAYESK